VRGQTSSLLASQRDQARHDIAAALASAYTRTGSWTGIDLTGAQALAQSTGAQLVILNEAGGRVATVIPSAGQDHGQDHQPGHDATHAPGHDTGGHNQSAPQPSGMHREDDGLAPAGAAGSAVLAAATASPAPAPTASPSAAGDRVPVAAGGKTVGIVVIDFPPASESAAWQACSAILQAVGLGTAAAVVLAGAAALLVSRRTTRPLTAAGAVERGGPGAEQLLRPAPGELGQVPAAFATMARSLRHEDQLRRTFG